MISFRPVLAVTLLTGVLGLAGQAQAADQACKHSADEKSVYVRALQTNLMVSALTCNISDQYNTFIHQFQPVLIKDAKQLTAYYKKRHGKSGTTELNAFVTHLANDDSQHSIQVGQADYCDAAAKLFTTVLALKANEIEDYATTQDVPLDAPVKACAKPKEAAVVVPGAAGTTTPAPAAAKPGDASAPAAAKSADTPAGK